MSAAQDQAPTSGGQTEGALEPKATPAPPNESGVEADKASNTPTSAQPNGEQTDTQNGPGEQNGKQDGPIKQDEPKPQEQKKGPAGGFDATPVPGAPSGYTVRITFHRAERLPMADLATLSSDPYIRAELRTSLSTRHKEDPVLRFRSHTIWRSTKPQWDEDWIVAHIPADGFKLKLRIYDEDSNDHDDRLGNVHIHVDRIDEKWQGIHDQEFRIKKRSGSKRAYLLRAIAVGMKRVHHMSGSMFVSVEVLGPSEGDDGGRAYTTGRNYWCKHYSPLLGRITGTKGGHEDTEYHQPTGEGDEGRAVKETADDATKDGERKLDASEKRRVGSQKVNNPELAENNATNGALAKVIKKEQAHLDKKRKDPVQRYNFEANQIQFTGPVPPELYHRFVEFRPFVKSLFTKKGIRGNVLAHALHHQHMQVYNFNRDTRYGVFDAPCRDMTLKFLELCHFAAGGRIFTYVLTLDALLRFTETGKEFGIDMLSKHTMHSDSEIYIAFSGEFFVRRLRTPYDAAADAADGPNGKGAPAPDADVAAGRPTSAPPLDPAYYELVIDNDSGTYRPNAQLLPRLREFLQRNLPGLRITTLDCQADETLQQRLKTEQRERKKKAQGNRRMVYTQVNASDSSISSSDEERLERLEDQDEQAAQLGAEEAGGVKQTHKLGEAVAPLVGNHPHVRKGLGEKPAVEA
ncbi:hypothetical protein FH972_021041 [Carpinus fangiana]|uniref:C2 domain-containing protein n=1 Tax=Carpinus fangiana TaxID=176857 RepID=A0A5N6KN70_9ROSI|nr:hypothetical protein FH972_021041 [Carpinus fangiana]